MIFSLLAYDYPLLWSPQPTPPGYLEFVEAHLRFLHASPPLIPRLLHIIIAVALCGFIIKLHRPSQSNLLFDGASLVLFMCCIIVYVANVVKGLRTVEAGAYGGGGTADTGVSATPSVTDVLSSSSSTSTSTTQTSTPGTGDATEGLLTKADTLKVLSASNTIMALVLVGVLVLQAGQWYAERKEQVEIEAMERKAKVRADGERAEQRNNGAGGNGNHGGHGRRASRELSSPSSPSSPTSRKYHFQQQQLHEAFRKRL